MMDNLMVGEAPLNIQDLVALIVNSPSYPRLVQSWKTFAQSLEVNYGNNLDLKRKVYGKEQLRELLITWSSEKGSGATLSVLCDALSNCQVEDISESLEKKYWLVAVKSLRIKLHERIIRLDEVSNQITEDKYKNIYHELKTSIYTQPIELFKEDLIPKIGTNYIPRTLHCTSHAGSDTEISEDDLLKIVQKDGDGDHEPIIISDSPGMGKSLLLANLALKLKAASANNLISIPIFVASNELASSFRNSSSLVFEVNCKELACKSEVGKLILEEMFQNEALFHIVLFLDGYDEVGPCPKLDLIDDCLIKLKQKKNFGICVSTRPHFRSRLENILNTISYGILPFNRTNQIQFLTSYWACKMGKPHEGKLNKYGKKCLKALNQQFPLEDQGIARIPLHCMHLAEILLEDAKQTTNIRFTFRKPVCTALLFDLYKALVYRKLGRARYNSSVKYWLEGRVMMNDINAHVYESITLLFPDWIPTFESDLKGFDEISEDILYSSGLIEKCPCENRRKFVDKRFAEYMLAEYLVKNLKNHSKCFEMLFRVILQYDEVEVNPFQYPHKVNKTYGLKHPATNYFVNMLLGDEMKQNYFAQWNDFVLRVNQWKIIGIELLCKAIELCAVHDLEFCIRLAVNLFQCFPLGEMTPSEFGNIREKYFRFLPYLVVERSNNTRLAITVLEFLQLTFGMDLTSHKYKSDRHMCWPWIHGFTPFHMAVFKGRYDMVHDLIWRYGDEIFNMKYMLHVCVCNSSNDTETTIEEKLSIVTFLLSYNFKWLNEKLYDCKPSEAENIHPRLRERLLELEEDSSEIEALSFPSHPTYPFSEYTDHLENLKPIVINYKKLIGTGSGNTIVYEGTFGDRTVAVKVMKVTQDEVGNVQREIQTLVKCDDHDNIVKYLCESHSESNGKIEYLLAMELCESDLKEFVNNREACLEKWNITEIPSSVEVLRQITEGLYHLHTREEPIIHRDLKPENILVKVRHGKIVVKLTDFGISKVIAHGKTHHTVEDFAGTPGWVAPELVYARRSKKAYVHLTLKSDIFSLGCVFWYVLSNGQHLFPLVDDRPSFEPILHISSLKNQTSYYGFLRLILFMIDFEGKDRPSIEDVKNHPIFWPAERRLLFLTEAVDVSNRYEFRQVENWLKANYLKLAGGRHSNFDKIFSIAEGQQNGWLDCLSDNIQNALQNRNARNTTPYSYNGKSLIGLLRGIRNLKAHIKEKEDCVKNDLFQSRDDFISYWHSPGRFPFLFDFVWTAFQSIGNSDLQSFYGGISFNFTKIMKNENQFVV